MNSLHIISIILEAVVALLSIMLAVSKKKIYGWFIALTFIIYVFYDLAKFLSLNISDNVLYFLFFLATLSILWAVWSIFREG